MPLALAGGSLLTVLAVFLPHLGGLWAAWQTEEYSHGLLIPPIALLIGWHRLTQFKPAPAPSWTGALAILAGFALLAIAQLSAFDPPSHYGFVLSLAGIILAFFGWPTLRALTPAFLYLIFAIPLPRLIEVALTAKMQLASTTIGVAILQLLGVSVFQDGNIIDLGTEKLQVVEACSGLRYLFPLLSFGFLIAFLFDGAMWKRGIIFLSAIPVTLGTNALRIALAGIMVNQWGKGMAEGFVHDFEGWVVFALCITLLLAETWVLAKIGSRRESLRLDYIAIPSGALLSGKIPAKSPAGIAALGLCLLLGGALTFADLNNRKEIIPAHSAFALFPLSIGDWRGQQQPIDPSILETLSATDSWNAEYRRDTDAAPVGLFMAWYASQRVGAAAHSPANCIPGSGWRITHSDIIPLALNAQSIPVTRMLIRKDNASLLVYYWFDQRGRIINEQYGAKWYLLVDSITRHRTDGAIVRAITPLSAQEPESAGDARLGAFLRTAYPSIKGFIPQ